MWPCESTHREWRETETLSCKITVHQYDIIEINVLLLSLHLKGRVESKAKTLFEVSIQKILFMFLTFAPLTGSNLKNKNSTIHVLLHWCANRLLKTSNVPLMETRWKEAGWGGGWVQRTVERAAGDGWLIPKEETNTWISSGRQVIDSH